MFGLDSIVPAIGGVAVLGVALGAGGLYLHHEWYSQGAASVQAKWDEDKEKQREDTITKNTGIADDWAANLKEQNAKLADVTAKYDDATKRLRDSQRANTRLAGAAARACTGATGAELSRPDAGFSSWEAARAEGLRVRLGKAYERIDELQKRLDPKYVPPAFLPEPVEPDWSAKPK